MNAPQSLFVRRSPIRRLAMIAGSVSACALLGGCILGSDARMDTRSPIAAEAPQLAKTNRDFPDFNEIPPVPNDVRPRAMYGQQAQALVQQREDLEAATAPNTWTLTGTEGFAETGRRDAGPERGPIENTNTEAFARELRQRATPPPPPQR